MKNILDKLSMFLQGLAVIISLMAGAIILLLASLWEKIVKRKFSVVPRVIPGE